MKKIVYLSLLALLFGSCQKQNYVTSIPAPTFTYFTSNTTPKPIRETNFEASTAGVLSPEIITPPISISASISASTTEPEATTLISNNKVTGKATRTTLKQRIVKRFVEKKINKLSVQQSSKPKANRADGIAVTSFIAAILGIIGMFTTGWLFLIGMVGAIVLGFVGLSRIRHSNGELGGRGWALAGLILGFAELLLLILSVVFIASIIGAFGA